MTLVLSLFPGIGLLDLAFEQEGFCVVRGPDLLWGGDIRRFYPPAGVFAGVIGGPPCQPFSIMRRLNPKCGANVGNLIPEYERCVREAQPGWYVMEEVPNAPVPEIEGYLTHAQLLRDVWVGGVTMRMRRISFGTKDGRRLPVETLALHACEPEQAVLAGGSGRQTPVALGGSGKPKRTAVKGRRYVSELESQGLPADWLDGCPLTSAGKRRAIGNGVPLPMGRAIAKAVRSAMLDAEPVAP
jgi:DNA (cytosine-5)-methyltransferase 1